MKDYSKNIILIKIYSILLKRVTMPIIVLYFLLNNLNYTQIGILASVMAITVILFEVPSGVFADKIGRKKSLLITSIFGLFSMALYLVATSFTPFLLATICFAISTSFASGTRNALLYDTLKTMKKENQYKKHLGELHLFVNIVNGLILIAVPFIYLINERYPFVLGMTFYLTSLVILFFIKEPLLLTHEQTSIKKIINNSKKEIKNNKILLILILFFAAVMGFAYATSPYYQPLMKNIEFPIVLFGVIYFTKRLLTGVSASFAHKLENRITVTKTLLLIGLLVILSYLASANNLGMLVLIGILGYSFTEGIAKVYIEDEINKKTSSGNRSTTLSVAAFSREILIAILSLVYGVVADLISIKTALIFGALVFTIVYAVLLIVYKKVILNENQH